jgi:hypothetical protein
LWPNRVESLRWHLGELSWSIQAVSPQRKLGAEFAFAICVVRVKKSDAGLFHFAG